MADEQDYQSHLLSYEDAMKKVSACKKQPYKLELYMKCS